MRLWKKAKDIDDRVLNFTVGDDHLLDLRLVKYDCIASKAHAQMLQKIGALTEDETNKLCDGLSAIMELAAQGKFKIEKEEEDCHTAIEAFLTRKYGEVGKKIHLGRSRNDQVLTAVRLYEKEMLKEIKGSLENIKETLTTAIEKYGNISLPGYTHMRKAMPTTAGIWFGSFNAAFADDLFLLDAVYRIIDQSPLGTAAGFGTPVFKIDRKTTAKLMDFSSVQENPVYAQFSRGKFEMGIMSLLTGIMLNLNKLATDLLLFSMEEFGFFVMPEEFCTGSSIMPQKSNPDVLELIRAKYSIVLGEEFKVKSVVANLMSGYNRDIQLTKKPLFTAFDTTFECLEIMSLIISRMLVDKKKCMGALTDELYATEEVYNLAKAGMPFRDAYKKIGQKYTKSPK